MGSNRGGIESGQGYFEVGRAWAQGRKPKKSLAQQHIHACPTCGSPAKARMDATSLTLRWTRVKLAIKKRFLKVKPLNI